MPIKAVLFDLGDTLIKSTPSVYETFKKILEKEGVQVSVHDVERAFATAEAQLGPQFKELMGTWSSSEFYQIWDSHVLKALEIEDDGYLAKKTNEEWFNTIKIHMFPDTESALFALRERKIKTGIISNAYQEEIYLTCEMVNLDITLFDIIVGVDTAHNPKPCPEIFMYALENLNMNPEEVLYVGNDLENDYRGSQAVGMNSLLIVREDPVPEQAAFITELTSVVDHLTIQ